MVRILRMLSWPMLTRPGWYLTSVNALAEESIHGNFELYMKDLLFTMVFTDLLRNYFRYLVKTHLNWYCQVFHGLTATPNE